MSKVLKQSYTRVQCCKQANFLQIAPPTGGELRNGLIIWVIRGRTCITLFNKLPTRATNTISSPIHCIRWTKKYGPIYSTRASGTRTYWYKTLFYGMGVPSLASPFTEAGPSSISQYVPRSTFLLSTPTYHLRLTKEYFRLLPYPPPSPDYYSFPSSVTPPSSARAAVDIIAGPTLYTASRSFFGLKRRHHVVACLIAYGIMPRG